MLGTGDVICIGGRVLCGLAARFGVGVMWIGSGVGRGLTG